MQGKQAKIVSPTHERALLGYLATTRYPSRDRVMGGVSTELITHSLLCKFRWCPSTSVMRFCWRNTTKYEFHKGQQSPDSLAVPARR